MPTRTMATKKWVQGQPRMTLGSGLPRGGAWLIGLRGNFLHAGGPSPQSNTIIHAYAPGDGSSRTFQNPPRGKRRTCPSGLPPPKGLSLPEVHIHWKPRRYPKRSHLSNLLAPPLQLGPAQHSGQQTLLATGSAAPLPKWKRGGGPRGTKAPMSRGGGKVG